MKPCLYAVLSLSASMGLSTIASGAVILQRNIFNHPDAAKDPPPYGLRLDNLYLQAPAVGSLAGGVGGVTTFSFDPADGGNMVMTVDLVGSTWSINLAGTAFGGVDTGTTAGFGAGLYSIDFTYSVNVSEVTGPNGGYQVTPNSQFNTGTITALSGPDVAAGTSWSFFDQTNANSNTFKVLRDGHRLGAFPSVAALNPLVGRGWVTYNSNGTNSTGTQDWLFIDIPAPSVTGVLALGGLVSLRRRRS